MIFQNTPNRYIAPLLRLIVAIATLMQLSSCISDDQSDCGVWLEFVYDHNMEYSDSFSQLVDRVDIFVFDSEGRFLFSRHADCAVDLTGRKKMLLCNSLQPGTYHIITVGGLCDAFSFADSRGNPCSVGVTTIEDVRIALQRSSAEVSHEFPHLWYSGLVTLEHYSYKTYHRVPLIRESNKFDLAMISLEGREEPDEESAPYTFEIETPEGAVYGWDNSPLSDERVTYKPYWLGRDARSGYTAQARINTLRLFDDPAYDYRLTVRDMQSGEQVWSYDLMELLAHSKPATRPDGTPLPMQEYLDRESQWNLTLRYSSGDSGFMAVSIEINGWILWLSDIEM